jgi:hypothetical protein
MLTEAVSERELRRLRIERGELVVGVHRVA